MNIKPSFIRVCRLAGIASISLSAFAAAQEGPKEAPAAEAPAEEKAAPAMAPEEVKLKASYALGLRAGSDFAQQFARYGVEVDDLDFKSFLEGFKIAYQEKDLPESVTEESLKNGMEAFGKQVQEREEKIAAANKEAGAKFLAENGKKEGVVTTASGLQYEIINKGGAEKFKMPADGQAPQKLFMVHYKGTLIDGTEFDKSPEGETVPMTLQVVPGFREALTTMPIGAKWRLYLSPELAYGEQRASSKIAPNSTLIFDLELKAIEDAPPQQGFPFQIPGQ